MFKKKKKKEASISKQHYMEKGITGLNPLMVTVVFTGFGQSSSYTLPLKLHQCWLNKYFCLVPGQESTHTYLQLTYNYHGVSCKVNL